MQAQNFDLNRYLQRIGYAGPAHADINTVRSLMRHQLRTVPFENLDVQAGKVVSLVPEDIVGKICGWAARRLLLRGQRPVCHGLAGLGGALSVCRRPAHVLPRAAPQDPHGLGRHTWMARHGCATSGFGSWGIREPLRLDQSGQEVQQDCDTFKLTQTGEQLFAAGPIRRRVVEPV
jgi:N-hydroxyarylamine O-acetyltransferase